MIIERIKNLITTLAGRSKAYPIRGKDGHRYRLHRAEELPAENNGFIGRVATYERKGDDTRWIQVAPGVFRDNHQPL